VQITSSTTVKNEWKLNSADCTHEKFNKKKNFEPRKTQLDFNQIRRKEKLSLPYLKRRIGLPWELRESVNLLQFLRASLLNREEWERVLG
jgi:hypothetical protein